MTPSFALNFQTLFRLNFRFIRKFVWQTRDVQVGPIVAVKPRRLMLASKMSMSVRLAAPSDCSFKNPTHARPDNLKARMAQGNSALARTPLLRRHYSLLPSFFFDFFEPLSHHFVTLSHFRQDFVCPDFVACGFLYTFCTDNVTQWGRAGSKNGRRIMLGFINSPICLTE